MLTGRWQKRDLLMVTPEEELSVKSFASRMADIDFWLRFVKWSGISLLVLGTAAVWFVSWLYTFKTNVDDAKSKVDAMRPVIDQFSERLNNMEKQFSRLQSHQLDADLQARTAALGANEHPVKYEWSDYSSDIQQLADL